jgi:hypothetical protein
MDAGERAERGSAWVVAETPVSVTAIRQLFRR